jgi:membrane carboxypeptidase/penicillin-binding protein
MGEVKFRACCLRLVFFLGLAILLEASGVAASVSPRTITPHRKSRTLTENQHARKRMHTLAKSRVPRSQYSASSSATHRRHRYYGRFHTSSFASAITEGDVTAGEDPVVREAAIDALGNMNGTVVAIEPTSGRILAMVNQRLALSSGAQPCSTIKLSVALAALSEGVIDKETEVSLGRRSRMNLTTALAHSNNAYFEAVGRKLGFEKVQYYAHQFGLGELAGYQVPGEQ